MSFPNIPRGINPDIDLPIDQIVNLLLASIAFEELGLAHIINAEAEKIQFVLGTLPHQTIYSEEPSIDDLIKIDGTLDMILKDVIKKEMLLEFMLENITGISTATTTTTTTSTTTTTTTATYRYLSGSGIGTLDPAIDFNIDDPIIQNPHNPSQSGNFLGFTARDTTIPPTLEGVFVADLTSPMAFICASDKTLIIAGSGTFAIKRASTVLHTYDVDFTYTFVMNTAPTKDQAGLDLYLAGTIDHIFGTNGTHDFTGSISFTCPIP